MKRRSWRLTQTPYNYVLKMSTRTLVSRWVPVIAWMVLIFAGSSDVLSAEHTSRFLVPFLRWLDPHISFAAIAAIHLTMRKLGHLTEYAVLAALLWRAFRGKIRSTRTFAIAAMAIGLAALFAASDEFHQSFVATRTASGHDVMIDIGGAIFGMMICWMLSRKNEPARATI
ncbi:MAG: VanZ family protein [Spartobacteria bacterium]